MNVSREEKPRIRLTLLDGRWVPLTALAPMSAAARELAARESRERIRRLLDIKAAEVVGGAK